MVYYAMPEWRRIPGFDHYEVSNRGQVRNIVGTKRWPPCILKPWKSGQYRYLMVTLCTNGRQEKYYVAHLVAWLFLGRRQLGKRRRSWQVNHMDGNRYNNCVENLEYCTHRKNHQHAVKMGLTARGEANGTSKLKEADVRAIRASADSAQILRKRYNVALDLIYQIRRRNIWKHVD